MKKVKIIHYLYGLSNGGVESVLLNYFSHIDLSNYSLDIVIQKLPQKNCEDKLKKLGFKIYVVPSKKHFIKYSKQMINILKKEKPNIVHCHMNYGNFVPLFFAKLMKVPKRISHSHLAIKKFKLKNVLMKFLGKMVATDYMACGEKAAISLFGKKNVENGKVYILNNAIDYDAFKYNDSIRKKIRNELKIKDDEIVLGNVARFTNQKNHKFIIEVFQKCYDANSKYKLLLVGSGFLKEKIEKLVEEKNLGERVIFLEHRDDVNELLSAMDIFILPSLYEGLPVSVLEAQAANLPCLLSDTITRECKLLSSTKYLSIENSDDWRKCILNMSLNNRKINNKKIFEQANFEIENEAKKLDDFYRK